MDSHCGDGCSVDSDIVRPRHGQVMAVGSRTRPTNQTRSKPSYGQWDSAPGFRSTPPILPLIITAGVTQHFRALKPGQFKIPTKQPPRGKTTRDSTEPASRTVPVESPGWPHSKSWDVSFWSCRVVNLGSPANGKWSPPKPSGDLLDSKSRRRDVIDCLPNENAKLLAKSVCPWFGRFAAANPHHTDYVSGFEDSTATYEQLVHASASAPSILSQNHQAEWRRGETRKADGHRLTQRWEPVRSRRRRRRRTASARHDARAAGKSRRSNRAADSAFDCRSDEAGAGGGQWRREQRDWERAKVPGLVVARQRAAERWEQANGTTVGAEPTGEGAKKKATGGKGWKSCLTEPGWVTRVSAANVPAPTRRTAKRQHGSRPSDCDHLTHDRQSLPKTSISICSNVNCFLFICSPTTFVVLITAGRIPCNKSGFMNKREISYMSLLQTQVPSWSASLSIFHLFAFLALALSNTRLVHRQLPRGRDHLRRSISDAPHPTQNN